MTSLERLPDRWSTRDYPVLLEAARTIDNGERAKAADIAVALGLDEPEVDRSIVLLKDAGYLDERPLIARPNGKAFGYSGYYLIVTERGRRTVGLWPNDEQVADNLLWFLEQKVEQASTADERSRWTKIRDGLAAGGRDVVIELVAAIAARGITG